MRLKNTYKLLLLAIFLGLSPFGIAQDWLTKSTSDFHFYFQNDEENEIARFDSIFRMDLGSMQQAVNYYINQPVDVFICANASQRESFLEKKFIGENRKGGEIQLNSYSVPIDISANIRTQRKQFKERIVLILVAEMMSGSSLQDNIKSANLLHLPEWVVPGLALYLSDDWSNQTDNRWRYVYDKYTFKNLNNLPSKYNAIKGASFWKYMHHKYGDNAISTVLYMARLTRKFNAALYYSFQESSKSIFADWVEFYDQAYAYDQQKATPVDGHVIPFDQLIDLSIINTGDFLSLQQTPSGYKLYRHNSNGTNQLRSLPNHFKPLPKFSGSIQRQKGKMLVFGYKENEFGYIAKSGKFIGLKMRFANEIKAVNDDIFMLQSSTAFSELFLFSKEDPVLKVKGYISSMDILGDRIIYTLGDLQDVLVVQNWKTGNVEKRFGLAHSATQLEFANDSIVLYNSDANGILNGKMINVNSQESLYLTNYRSNIEFHDYAPAYFAEYVNRDEESALFITEALAINEFYTYDSISPSYFNTFGDSRIVSQNEEIVIEYPDSLEEYTFQNPFPEANDFTLSDYDSLLALANKSKSNIRASTVALDKFSLSSLALQVFNQLIEDKQFTYEENLEVLTPDIFFLRANATYQNRFNNKAIDLEYVGVLHPGNRDLRIGYSIENKWKLNVSILHRQRLYFDEDYRTKFLTNKLSFTAEKELTSNVLLHMKPYARLGQAVRLATNDASLNIPIENRTTIGSEMGIRYNYLNGERFKFESSLSFNPYVRTQGESINMDSRFSYSSRVQPKPFFYIEHKSKLATSTGNNPTFFIVGGLSNDILSNVNPGQFASYTEAGFYSFEYGVRGFPINYRNGTTMATSSLDIGVMPFDLIVNRPLTSEVFSNMEFIAFADIATSFYGRNYYNSRNVLNTTTVVSPTGVIVAQVNALKNPVIGSFGGGLATRLYSYRLRLDIAYGMEEGNIRNPVTHFSIGIPLY